MASFLRSRPLVPVACLSVAVAIACACGGTGTKASSASTTTGTSSSTSGSASTGGGTTTTTSSTSASTSSSAGTGGDTGTTTLALPQFVHGAAYVDTSLYTTIPVVVAATGMTPDSVEVSIDGKPTAATMGADGWVADVAMTLSPGPHALVATAKAGGNTSGMVTGSLVAGDGSLEFTHVATDGISFDGNMIHDVAGDALVYTWVDDPGGSKHQLWMNRLDGSFKRLLANDVAINDPNDEPLSGYTALSAKGLGVVYMVQKPNDPHWLVKLRVVDPMGTELVPAVDLTQGEAAFSMQAAGADPGGFSGAWLHISPPGDGGAQPPVEVRFARWDMTANKLVGPITLDMDQPPDPSDSGMNPQTLEPLAELSVACNTSICLVAYVRDVYDATAATAEPKVLLATVDLASGTMAGTPVLVGGKNNFDFQGSFGQQVVTLADGSFVLVYQETLLLPPPCSPPMYGAMDACCMSGSEEGDAFYVVKIDATGQAGVPTKLYGYEGSREYPRIAPHPAGFALFWEDQRTECAPLGGPPGHIGMSANVGAPALTSLLDPYVELPGSIALPGESPSLAVAGTNFVLSWSDNRNGMGLVEDNDEQYLETYWRK